MTVSEALADSSVARADAEVLLAHAMDRNRAWLLAHPEVTLTPDQASRWNERIARRRAGEPCAYITGEREFYGRSFQVDRRVLIPRPSTEGLIDLVLQILRHPRDESIDLDSGITGYARVWGNLADVRTIVDIGTGSGCIAVTLACERPDLRVIATDVSADAIAVARSNAERHGVTDRLEFRAGDALEPIVGLDQPFLLVSNPPYIPDATEIMEEVRAHEPHAALFGGKDGADVARKIAEQAKTHPFCQGMVMECETEQVMGIMKMLL